MVVQENHYDPWGLSLPLNVDTEKGGSPTDRFKFIDRESQRETNWIDLQARFYDPQIGMFLAVDPLTEGQDAFSPYHYSFNNPIRYSDPDGRFPIILPLLPYLAGAVAEAGVIGAAVATTVYGGAILLKKGIEAGVSGSAFSPGTGAAMSLSTPGKITGGYKNASGSKGDSGASNKGSSATTGGNGDENKSRKGALNEAKRDAGIPRSQHPNQGEDGKQYQMVPMTDRNGKPVFGSDGKRVMTREYNYTKSEGAQIIIQDHSAGHPQFGNEASKPHFNVRPPDDTRNGRVPGTNAHYPFDPFKKN
jgi:RHS repeat-associated protein